MVIGHFPAHFGYFGSRRIGFWISLRAEHLIFEGAGLWTHTSRTARGIDCLLAASLRKLQIGEDSTPKKSIDYRL